MNADSARREAQIRAPAASGQGEEAVQKSHKVKRKGLPARAEQLRRGEMEGTQLLVTFERGVILYAHFRDDKIEAPRDSVARPRSYSFQVIEPRLKPASLAPQSGFTQLCPVPLPLPAPVAALAGARLRMEPCGIDGWW